MWRLLFSFLIFLFANGDLGMAAESYDAYFNAVTGSTTIIGLGGAYRAEAKGAMGAAHNPAGVSLMDSWWDATFTVGSFEQSFRSVSEEVEWSTSELAYANFGLVFKIPGSFQPSFGVLLHSPFSQHLEGKARSDAGDLRDIGFDFDLAQLIFPFSIRATEKISLGANINILNAETRFSEVATAESEAREAFGVSFDFGGMVQWTNRYTMALTYQSGASLKFEDENKSMLSGYTPFREAKLPHRVFLGNSFLLHPRWKLLWDWGVIVGMGNAILPGSGLSEQVASRESGQETDFQYHVGVEHLLVPGKWEVRAGHYYQPSRAQQEPPRFHFTGGLDYFFWYIKSGFAFDVSKDYFNLALSISPSFQHRKRWESL